MVSYLLPIVNIATMQSSVLFVSRSMRTIILPIFNGAATCFINP
jgi:hypothetical protein